jgi:hypothetical protein
MWVGKRSKFITDLLQVTRASGDPIRVSGQDASSFSTTHETDHRPRVSTRPNSVMASKFSNARTTSTSLSHVTSFVGFTKRPVSHALRRRPSLISSASRICGHVGLRSLLAIAMDVSVISYCDTGTKSRCRNQTSISSPSVSMR